jgi:cytochrome d ubiquinol oxidase subunit I
LDTGRRVPLIIFAIPDQKSETNHFVIELPFLGSLILAHNLDGEIKGLKDWPAQDLAPVAIPFFAFRVMVGIGILMLIVVVTGGWLRFRGLLFDSPWFLRVCLGMAPLGFVAVLAGWTTTEVGRQPWTVYGLLRTVDSVSPSLTGVDVLISLLGYMAVYLVIFPAGVVVMTRIVRKGPAAAVVSDSPIESGRSRNPITVRLQSEVEA